MPPPHTYALVTGGTHGIGLAIARRLHAHGCEVAVCSRTQARLDAATTEGLWAIRCDVLEPADIERCLVAIKARWGGVHVLVNNAGGGGRWGSEDVSETGDEVWAQVWQKNAGAAAAFTRRSLGFMQRAGWGRVVTVASIYGSEAGGRPWFNMAKAAEVSLMKSLAIRPELARAGITFNTVSPGGIMVEGSGFGVSGVTDEDMAGYPLGRLGTPDEVAAVVAFLCSDEARLVNGANVAVDGGQGRRF